MVLDSGGTYVIVTSATFTAIIDQSESCELGCIPIMLMVHAVMTLVLVSVSVCIA